MLRICNSVLSVLTLLLIATAASKMALYIQAYGLTVKRVFASVFLVWMAISFVLILIRQVRRFRLVSWMVFTGAVLYCALCVLPVEAGIDAYNQARVEAGTLRPAAQTLLDLPDGSAAEMAWGIWVKAMTQPRMLDTPMRNTTMPLIFALSTTMRQKDLTVMLR